jgi:hypothetical protein
MLLVAIGEVEMGMPGRLLAATGEVEQGRAG